MISTNIFNPTSGYSPMIASFIRKSRLHLTITSSRKILSPWLPGPTPGLCPSMLKMCHHVSDAKEKPSLFSYTIHGEELHRVSQHDYLGVTISNDLNWSKHCQKTAAKASRTLGMLRRTLSACSADVKARSYLSLVRPQLEYGSEAWNPHANNNVKRLENIQRLRPPILCSKTSAQLHLSHR